MKTKIRIELMRLKTQKVVRIVEVHAKTRVKLASAVRAFSSTKLEENANFGYSSCALAELLEKTRAKYNHTTIYMSRH